MNGNDYPPMTFQQKLILRGWRWVENREPDLFLNLSENISMRIVIFDDIAHDIFLHTDDFCKRDFYLLGNYEKQFRINLLTNSAEGQLLDILKEGTTSDLLVYMKAVKEFSFVRNLYKNETKYISRLDDSERLGTYGSTL